MIRLYSILLFVLVNFVVVTAQTTNTATATNTSTASSYEATLASINTLRSEIKMTHDSGKTRRVYYYDRNDTFVKVVNFSEDGKIFSLYNLDKGIKQEYIKYSQKTLLKEEQSYYHPNKKTAVNIYYDLTEEIEYIYIMTKKKSYLS